MMPLRRPAGFLILGFTLAVTSLRAETIWWEAEAAVDTSMNTSGAYAPSPDDVEKISGGEWLNGQVSDGLYADYTITVREGGKYGFYVRRFWLHGAFRWRFDDRPWVSVEGLNQTVLDQEKTAKGPVTWVDLGYVELAPGEHKVRIEIVGESEYQFNKVFAFDCFALSNDGFTPKGVNKEGGVRKSAPSPAASVDGGRNMGRTMALLESATPSHRTPVTIFFYGQSIVQNSNIDQFLVKYLREKYPNARISFKNLAIGGYQAPVLRRTAWQDLYPQNADLIVFHVYGGENGELEEIFHNIRQYSTADVLTWTHHIDNYGAGIDQKEDEASGLIQKLGEKYGLEVADARTLWKERLKETHEPRQTYLVDQIHLNPKGTALLGEALTPHFRVHPQASANWQKQVRTLALAEPSPDVTYSPDSWKATDGGLVSTGVSPLRIAFHGNRADIVPLPGSKGGAKILLDGMPPSAVRDTLAASRATLAPGSWWPAITRVALGDNAVVETITMQFHDVSPDGTAFAFEAVGSKSGDEGAGKAGQDFTARSGRFSIKAEDFAIDSVKKVTKKDLPEKFTVSWDVVSMSADEWKSPARWPDGVVFQDTVVRCWKDGPHVIEIIPSGDGPVALRDVMTFSPKGQD